MNRIIINELDLTTNGSNLTTTDVVFVPGFSAKPIQELNDKQISTSVARPFIPTLCQSIEEFELYFGTAPAIFTEDQYYPYGVGAVEGFSKNAIPNIQYSETDVVTPVWFKKGDPDPSYIYAKELLLSGIPVVYDRMNYIVYKNYDKDTFDNGVYVNENNEIVQEQDSYDVTVSNVYTKAFKTIFGLNSDESEDSSYEYLQILDKNECQFKFLTSGGYPVYEYGLQSNNSYIFAQAMAKLAATRGDCVALIDHTDNPDRALNAADPTSVFYQINTDSGFKLPEAYDSFAAMFTPWINVNCNGTYFNETTAIMPGSFAYLTSLANSIKVNANWLAIAGVARGLIPNIIELHTTQVLTNAIAESYQHEPAGGTGISINPITRIRPYGFCIWGNRTLRYNKISRVGFATSFLNLRNMVSDVKKTVYQAAQRLMFEQNNDILWINFKALITPLLDSMVSGYGLSGYKIIKNASNDKTRLSAIVKLYPIYAVESFEITIVLSDQEITIE